MHKPCYYIYNHIQVFIATSRTKSKIVIDFLNDQDSSWLTNYLVFITEQQRTQGKGKNQERWVWIATKNKKHPTWVLVLAGYHGSYETPAV